MTKTKISDKNLNKVTGGTSIFDKFVCLYCWTVFDYENELDFILNMNNLPPCEGGSPNQKHFPVKVSDVSPEERKAHNLF